MARPASTQPTEVEMQILSILWDSGPCTARDIHNRLLLAIFEGAGQRQPVVAANGGVLLDRIQHIVDPKRLKPSRARVLARALAITALTTSILFLADSRKAVAQPADPPDAAAANPQSEQTLPAEKTDPPKPADPNINRLNVSGFSKLHNAAQRGDATLVKELIEAGADLNVQQAKYKGAPLQYASSFDHIDAVRVLLDAGAKIDSADNIGRTPLMWAADKQNLEIAKLLVARGANVNAKTKFGWTPIMYARQRQADEIAQLLLDNGAEEKMARPSKTKTAPAKPPTNVREPFIRKPEPFISTTVDDARAQLNWEQVSSTKIDIRVYLDSSARIENDQVLLPIRIFNNSKQPIKTRLAREWHGGEWPPTNLYASVSDRDAVRLNSFAPVYVSAKESSPEQADSPQADIGPGETVVVNLRMDWSGTGSVKGSPLMPATKGKTFATAVMLVFEAEGKPQFTVSKFQEVAVRSADQVPKKVDPIWGALTDEILNKIKDRQEKFADEVAYLEIPAGQLPEGVRRVGESPAIFVPGESAADDAWIQFVGVFFGQPRSALITGILAAVYEDDLAGTGRKGNEIGVYVLRCRDEQTAQVLARPGMIRKGPLLVYVWKDEVRQAAFNAVRDHYLGKEFKANVDDQPN